MRVKIEEGKFYLDDDGNTIGPMKSGPLNMFKVIGTRPWYYLNGVRAGERGMGRNIVSETNFLTSP